MKTDMCCGVVSVKIKNGEFLFLLVQHVGASDHWGIPKGHPEDGDVSKKDTALRELNEETGINEVVLIKHKPLVEEYVFRHVLHGLINKTVHYYIGITKADDITLQANEIQDYRWCHIDDAVDLATYPETQQVLRQSHEILVQSRGENF